MVDLRNQAAFVRRLVKSRLLPAVGARRTSGSDRQVYARANPERVRLTERYFVRQEISGNPQKDVSSEPTGEIEIRVPYDGHEYFTRQACADVRLHAPRHRGAELPPALVGHLLLANYNRTDLGDVLGLRQRYGSVPVRVPVSDLGTDDDRSLLFADEQTCVISHDYRPDRDQLRVVPLDVKMDLFDPDSIDSYRYSTTSGIAFGSGWPDMTQQVSFRSHLILRVAVKATLPKVDGWRELRPEVEKVSLGWPTITSLRAVKLQIGDGEKPIRYNPLTRAIEWSGVEMSVLEPVSEDSDTLTYCSDPMFIVIEQPGELYQQDSLAGTVEVRIEDYLLSGVEARYANGIGRVVRRHEPERVTVLNAEMTLILDDAFAKRMVSPYQHLYFDEVIPDSKRIDDIEAALKDRGFEVNVVSNNPDLARLQASRSEGPNKMVLWLEVHGTRFTTASRSYGR
jgi:hypothetical protein